MTRRTASRSAGFTLIELLTVIVIISILATILISGAQYVVRLSRQKRYTVTCMALKTALSRYRAEYNEWPLAGRTPDSSTFSVTVSDKDNANVFHMLREDNQADNPKGIRFLDETALFTRYDGNRMTLLRARLAANNSSTRFPLLYVDANTGADKYFTVVMDVDDDTVDVR